MRIPAFLARACPRLSAFLLVLSLPVSRSGAAVLVSYMGGDITVNVQSLAPDAGSVAANLTASNITQSVSAVTTSAAFSSTTDAFFARADTVANDFATSITSNDFITFSVTVAAGRQLDLSSLTFKLGASTGASGAYTTNAVLRTSVDGFAADVGSPVSFSLGANVSTATFADKSVTLTDSAFQGLTGTVTFRLYFADNLASTDTFTRVDALALNGAVNTVSAVPEPASGAALAGAAVLAAAAASRRRRC